MKAHELYNHTGGLGKHTLYTSDVDLMNITLEFGSKPFTTLIRNMYLRFSSLSAYYTVLDSREKPNGSFLENFRKLGVQRAPSNAFRLTIAITSKLSL